MNFFKKTDYLKRCNCDCLTCGRENGKGSCTCGCIYCDDMTGKKRKHRKSSLNKIK